MNEANKGIKVSPTAISIIVLLVIQIIVFAFGYGTTTQQVKFNRELIQSYQNNQNSIMVKLDDLNTRITRIETMLQNRGGEMCWLTDLFKKDLTELKPAGVIDVHTASSILLDKLEEMGDDKAEIYLPDIDVKIYNKNEVASAHELEEVASIKYVVDEFDCDDYAAELYGKFAGLLWTMKHALNFFYSEDNEIWFIEPQTGKLSQTLEDWQGLDVRFFLAR